MNKFILSGNLCADPTFNAGQEESKHRCNFRIAFNHNKDKATFFSCTAWGKQAERVNKLKKGQRVLVEGDIEENEWTDQQGGKQRDKQVNVRNVEYIDFPDQAAQTAPTGYQPTAAPPGYHNQPPAPGYGYPPPGGYQQQSYAPPVPQAQPPYGAPPQSPQPQYPPQTAYPAQQQAPVQPGQPPAPPYAASPWG